MEIGYLIILALLALIPANIAKNKGRSFWGFFVLSLFLSPLWASIIALIVPKKPVQGTVRQCPACGYQGIFENTCPHCHTPLSVSRQAKATLQEQLPQQTQPQQIPQQTLRRCTECGMQLKEDQKFCSHCGTKAPR